MKLNNKGWGTLEMLLLSGGLLVALLVSVFFISKLYGSFDNSIKNKQYNDLEVKLESAAKSYIIDKNIKVNGQYKISYETLKNDGYIKDFKDKDNNECNGYVLISKYNEEDITNYKGYVSCKNYKSLNY